MLQKLALERYLDENLSSRLVTIKEFTKKHILPFWQVHAPQFTEHGTIHITNVLSYLESLIPPGLLPDGEDSLRLNKYEIFLMLCGVCLHDVGMLQADESGTDAATREKHNLFSEELIQYHLAGLFDNQHERTIIGWLVYGHRRNVDINDKRFDDYPLQYGAQTFPIRVRLLASLIRLADACDLTHERSSETVIEIADYEPKALWHHLLHQYVSAVSVNHENQSIKVSYAVRSEEDAKIIEQERITELQVELNLVRDVLKANHIYLTDVKGDKHLDEHRPSIADEFKGMSKAKKAKSYTVKFLNRQYELERVCSPSGSHFFLIDAPAGFGKSWLLDEIAQRAKKSDWGCARVTFESGVYWSNSNILQRVARELFPNEELVNGDLEASIARLAARLANSQLKAVIFLFDAVERLDDASLVWLANDLVLGLDERLKIPGVEVRANWAGRYVAHKWPKSARLRPELLTLSPFDRDTIFRVVQDAAREATGKYLPADTCNMIVREIDELTGGHPKCIVQIIQKLHAARFAVALDIESPFYFFSESNKKEIFTLYTKREINRVIESIDRKTQDVLYVISVFRRFTPDILTILLNQGKLAGFRSGREVIPQLTATKLISLPSRNEPMYSDKILRRMLAAQMRIEEPDEYRKLNELAEQIYTKWVEGRDLNDIPLPKRPTDMSQIIFATEAIYHFLETMSMDKVLPPPQTVCAQLKDKLSFCLRELDSFSEEQIPDLASQLGDMLQEDQEIFGRVHQLAGIECYQALSDLISDFKKQKEERHG